MNNICHSLVPANKKEHSVSFYRHIEITDKLLETISNWQSHATVLINSKDWQGLVLWCSRWVKSEPTNGLAYANLGLGHTKLGSYQKAIHCCHRALYLNPEQASVMYTLGIAYYNIECYEEAIEAYHQALRINPEYTAAWNNLVITYSLSGKKEEALNSVEELRHLDAKLAAKLLCFIEEV